jgi:hypothetical protein
MSEKPTGRAGAIRPSRRFGVRALAAISMALLAVVVIGIAAGRNVGGGSSETAAVTSPACAGAGKYVDRPDSVPPNLLPPGTGLTSRMNLPKERTLVTGVIPLAFRSAVDFFVTKLPAAGYQLGAGDAEQDEAEAVFLGERVRGKWRVNGILNCPDAVTLTLLVSS